MTTIRGRSQAADSQGWIQRQPAPSAPKVRSAKPRVHIHRAQVGRTKYLGLRQQFRMMRRGHSKAKFRSSDASHRWQARTANSRASRTYRKAAADGVITKYEQRQINGANRNRNIANMQVRYDSQRRHLGNVEMRAARDGKITPAESRHIRAARGRLNRTGRALGRMRANDRRMDRSDRKATTGFRGFFNKIRHNIDSALGIGRRVGGRRHRPARLPRPRVSRGRVRHHHHHPGRTSRRIVRDSNGWKTQRTSVSRPRPRFTRTSQGYRSRRTGNVYMFRSARGRMLRSGASKARNRISDSAHKWQAHKANHRVSNAYRRARSDGQIGLFDRRNINSAKRDRNIANKQVNYDNARKHLGRLEQRFAADGKLTPGEQRHLSAARNRLGRLGGQLRRLRAQDRRMDKADAAFKRNPFNQFRNDVSERRLPFFRPMRPPICHVGRAIFA